MMEPSSCDTFVALPPTTLGNRIIFGKNSDRPSDEVQEIVYFPPSQHKPGEKVECTYIEIDQVPETFAVVLSRPSWLWGAEMGANEHGICIGNEAVWGREEIGDDEALLGMDLVRLGLERADSAEKAVHIITELLEKHGQGGNCMESHMAFTYHNSFLIADRKEAWVLETSEKHWAAENVKEGVRNISNQLSITRVDRGHPEIKDYARSRGWWDGEKEFDFAATYSYVNTARMTATRGRYCEGYKLLKKHEGRITAETMMSILRDKESGINMEGGFMTTGSMVSILPQDPSLPCIHFFTGTPDPDRSVFKPFVFVPNITQLLKTSSPVFGPEDPVKKKPRFQTKPDRRHELYKNHESAALLMEASKDEGNALLKQIRNLEKEKTDEMEHILQSGHLDVDQAVNLFSKCVEEEICEYMPKD
ncbi:PREDICTED: secernin-3 [Gekko japonicus]|uniref:Secernin-3 n=1 Tax=Gekko japonicus TaxID=146911 RepID=A0ABM1KZU0_GEKJA|nr:PREDICTED: secernin-3 [Gekko japonicus]XP_015279228.1 PREDICTED: secernin-3 [Gekko japonicus]